MMFLAFLLGTSFGLLIGAAAGVRIGQAGRRRVRDDYRYESAPVIPHDPAPSFRREGML